VAVLRSEIVVRAKATSASSPGQGSERVLRSKAPWLNLIDKALRTHFDAATHEALPTRWVDLIRQLDAQERQSLNSRSSEPPGDAK
jgi:hypothetical protein